MPELARDPSEQCTWVGPNGDRCLNGRVWGIGPDTHCSGPHRFTADPELARDPSEQCTAWDQDRRKRCLNRCRGTLAKGDFTLCEGPHRFTVEKSAPTTARSALGHVPVYTGSKKDRLLGCSCGVRYTTGNPDDECAEHIASVTLNAAANDYKARTRNQTEVTEEEYQLFDAVRAYYVKGTDQTCRDLFEAAFAWCKAHLNDHRTPTEIANGITDLMPTRARTVKAISSDNARRPPRVTHLLRIPTSLTGAECLMCHRLAADFDDTDMYTYERDLYKLDARRCDGAWYHPPAYQSDGPKRFAECLTCAAKPGSPTLCRSCQLNRDTIAWYQRALHAADVREMEARKAAVDSPEPVPMIMQCPACHARHIEGELAHKPHHTHACQACGFTWRPAVVPTTGVQFLPGFKDKEA